MRPTPAEIIQSARTLLRERIGPALAGEAQADLRRVMSALRDGRWNDAAFDLLRENAELAELARAAAVDPATAQRPATIGARLLEAARLHASCGTPRSFDAANEINRALRQALAELCAALRDAPLDGDGSLGSRIAQSLLRLQEPPT